jgi:hypothetical protein
VSGIRVGDIHKFTGPGRAGIRVLETDILERQTSLLGAVDAIRASNMLNLTASPRPCSREPCDTSTRTSAPRGS